MKRRWARLKTAATAAFAVFMLGGCGLELDRHQGDVGNKDLRPNNVVRQDANGNRVLTRRFANDQSNEMNRINGRRLNSNNLVGTHKNYRLEMSPDIGERISALEGVGAAYVMLTDKNAYVAVTPETGGGGEVSVEEAGGIGRQNLGHSEERYVDPNTGRVPSPGSVGSAGGTGYGDRYSGAGGTGIRPNNTQGAGTHGVHGTPGTGRGQGMSGAGSDVNPNGSTLTGGGGTFGTSGGPEGGGESMQSSRTGSRGGDPAEPPERLANGTLKERIAAEVLRLAPGIEQVYISNAPDFSERMSNYALDVQGGHPIQDYIVEFNAMVDRVFPANSGIEARAGRAGVH